MSEIDENNALTEESEQTANTESADGILPEQTAKTESADEISRDGEVQSEESAPAEAAETEKAEATKKKINIKLPRGLKNLFTKGISSRELKNYEHTPPTEQELKENILIADHIKQYFSIENNIISQPIRFLKAVDDVSLRVPYGKTVGIVGESGCGKTTLGRTILGLYRKTAGEVYFDGKNITDYTNHQMNSIRTDMQVIFQDPYSSLSPRFSIGSIIGEGVAVHKIVPKKDIKDYVINIMTRCGLQPQHYERYPYEFSGGQRQRICIARALAINPKFIVCDEPVSALDVSIQAQILNLLKELQIERNIAYMFISHDLSVVQHISDSVGVMYLGSMVESGPTDSIFYEPMHPYTRSLLSAVPVPDPRRKSDRVILSGSIPSPANPPSGCRFHTRCPECMEICTNERPVFKEYKKGHFCACHLYSQD